MNDELDTVRNYMEEGICAEHVLLFIDGDRAFKESEITTNYPGGSCPVCERNYLRGAR